MVQWHMSVSTSMVLTNVLNSLGNDDYSRQILRFWLQTGDRK